MFYALFLIMKGDSNTENATVSWSAYNMPYEICTSIYDKKFGIKDFGFSSKLMSQDQSNNRIYNMIAI